MSLSKLRRLAENWVTGSFNLLVSLIVLGLILHQVAKRAPSPIANVTRQAANLALLSDPIRYD